MSSSFLLHEGDGTALKRDAGQIFQRRPGGHRESCLLRLLSRKERAPSLARARWQRKRRPGIGSITASAHAGTQSTQSQAAV